MKIELLDSNQNIIGDPIDEFLDMIWTVDSPKTEKAIFTAVIDKKKITIPQFAEAKYLNFIGGRTNHITKKENKFKILLEIEEILHMDKQLFAIIRATTIWDKFMEVIVE